MKQTKKAISVFLVIAMLLCAEPLNGFVGLELPSLFDFKAEAATYSGTCGDNLTWTLYESGLLEITGSGPMGPIEGWIDSEDPPWWPYRSQINSVVIGVGVTTIDDWAFAYCECLTSVTIPDSVTGIGDWVFYFCTGLTSVTIPDSITTIGNYAFQLCRNLSSISIGSNVTAIGEGAFSACGNLTDVYYNSTEEDWNRIPIGLKNELLTNVTIHFIDGEIEPGVADYTSLYQAIKSFESLYSDDYTADSWAAAVQAYADACSVPDDLTAAEQYIVDELTTALTEAIDGLIMRPLNEHEVSGRCGPRANWIFNQLTGILKITGSGVMQNFLNNAGVPWYEYAHDIRAVRISNKITRIGDNSFYGCENLTSISIPDSVTVIGNYAFSGCKRLMNVQLGDNIESIGEAAFEYCSLLRRITFPNSLKSICGGAFIFCSSLVSISIPAGVTSLTDLYDINEDGCTIYFGGTEDEWYELFWEDLPNNITVKFSINSPGYEFADYSKVEAALELVPTDMSVYSNESASRVYYAVNSVVYDLELFYQNEVDKFATEIEDAIARLEYGKLCDYTQLNAALDEFFNLNPDNYTVESWAVVELAFVEAYTIPEDLYIDVKGKNQLMIDEAAYDLFLAIENLILNENPTIDSGTCGDNLTWTLYESGLLEITGVGAMPSYSEDVPPWDSFISLIKAVEIGDGVTTIGAGAFAYCNNLTNVTISESVINIFGYAFYKCEILTDVYYGSTEEVWLGKISIYSNNEPLTNATIHFNSPVHTHTYVWFVVTEPTATQDGLKNKVCSDCGDTTESAVIPATGFELTNGLNINHANNIVYGLTPGIDSLDGYTNVVADGCEWTYEPGEYGFGTGSKAILKNGDEIVEEYTVVIFGDVQGDGWYDGEDAFVANLIAKGLLDEDDVGSAMWTAADCNHDGVIDEADVELLSGAGLMLNDVDQSASPAELALNADYIEYSMLIDQSAGMHTGIIPIPDTDNVAEDTATPETNGNVESDEPATENDIEVIITNLFELIKKILSFVFSFIVK